MGLLRRLMGQPDAPQSVAPSEVSVTLFDGEERLEVKGESFNQESLHRVVSNLGREVPAILVPEPDNRYDPNAVSVWVGGLQVGHLAREDAAIYQSPITKLMRKHGTPVAVTGRIFGGKADKPTLGIWLFHDPAEFGLASSEKGPVGRRAPGILTGASGEGSSWRETLPVDRPAAIKALRGLLEKESDPLQRHFMFNDLEGHLYACREIFASALTEFEEACEKHHSEMDRIRPTLIAEFGGVPVLPTYRQIVIMKQKAHDYVAAILWAERGVSVYGEMSLRDDGLSDLQKRIERLRPKLS